MRRNINDYLDLRLITIKGLNEKYVYRCKLINKILRFIRFLQGLLDCDPTIHDIAI